VYNDYTQARNAPADRFRAEAEVPEV
jgi:hypothetical protein